MENWAKTFRKICRKRRSKYVWILFGTILGIFDILKVFGKLKSLIFFENFRRLDLPWKIGQKFFEKFAPKHVKTRLDTFGNDFGRFWNFEKFCIFLKIF